MRTVYRIGAALTFAALGAIGFYAPQPQSLPARAPAALPVPQALPLAPALPNIGLTEVQAEAITRIDLTRPDDDDAGLSSRIVLEKSGLEWRLAAPIKTRASASKVGELIDNLKGLELSEVIDPDARAYATDGLTDSEALHVVVWSAGAKVTELYLGKSTERGQLVRLASREGVFVIANTGPRHYSGFLYTRDVRSWRETSILDFGRDAVVAVEIKNSHGVLSFSRAAGGWSGSFARRDRNGRIDAADAAWPNFDAGKVEDFVRMYASLSADDFGEDKDRSASGVDRAEQTGGVVRFRLKDGAGDRTLRVGNLARTTTRWAIRGSRWAVIDGGDATLYALAPWTANWALADAHAFELAEVAQPNR